MGSRPMRIIFKPYRLQDGANMELKSDNIPYWRAETDFPCTKAGKHAFGVGVSKMTALANLLTWCPQDIKQAVQPLTEAHMYAMPDQRDFSYWQLNLDGSKPTRERWIYERQYFNTFGHLPND